MKKTFDKLFIKAYKRKYSDNCDLDVCYEMYKEYLKKKKLTESRTTIRDFGKSFVKKEIKEK